jgi:small subunit ribosomal protein S6
LRFKNILAWDFSDDILSAMAKYELTVLVDGKATAAKVKSTTEKLEKAVKEIGGKVDKSDNWGKMDLAYKLGKSDTGVYLFFEIELEGNKVKSLSNKLATDDSLLRYLVVKE